MAGTVAGVVTTSVSTVFAARIYSDHETPQVAARGEDLGAKSCQQILGMDRFGQDLKLMPLRSRLFEKISRGGLTGKQQDLTPRQDLPDLDSGFNAIHIGHDDVADDQIQPARSCPVDGGRASVNSGGVEAILVQNDGQSVGNDSFIIDYEDSRLCGLTIHYQVVRSLPGQKGI
jgi:hypothetical protein